MVATGNLHNIIYLIGFKNLNLKFNLLREKKTQHGCAVKNSTIIGIVLQQNYFILYLYSCRLLLYIYILYFYFYFIATIIFYLFVSKIYKFN